MLTMLTPYVAEETAYRREQLTRAWGHRITPRRPRHAGQGPRRGHRRVAVARSGQVVAAAR